MLYEMRFMIDTAVTRRSRPVRRVRSLIIAVLAVLALWAAVFTSSALADIYWLGQNSIGSANLDGSGVDPTFLTDYYTSSDYSIAVQGQYIYFSDFTGILRAKLDGSDVQTLIPASDGAGDALLAVSNSYIYWATQGPDIGRANLDGSDPDVSFIQFPGLVTGLAVDGSHLYWSQGSRGAGQAGDIGEANLDGSGVNDNFITSLTPTAVPTDIAVDDPYIYWTETNPNFPSIPGTIARATTSGADVDQSFIQLANDPIGLAINGSSIYWSETDGSSNNHYWIGRANLDGSNVDETNFISGLSDVGQVAVGAAGPLVVNSTALDRDTTEAAAGVCNASPGASAPVCTLPQAILTSNALGGAPISFDIPGGSGNTFDGSVPQIQDSSGLATPPLTAPTTIDGTTQPGAGQVELSGAFSSAGTAVGLTVGPGASGTTIRGMVINGYQQQIVLSGGDDTIQGDELGVDPGGSTAVSGPFASYALNQVDIVLDSSGSQIGGTAAGQGNVLGTGWVDPSNLVATAAILDEPSASGNVIQGNRIGVQVGAAEPLISPQPPNALPAAALELSGNETVGGSAQGAGNTIAPGADIAGASVVQGNTFLGPLSVSGDATIGGPTLEPGTGDGNVFLAPILPALSTSQELTLTSPAVVQGNTFTGDANGAIVVNTDGATIGGPLTLAGNVIENDATLPSEPSSPTQPYEHAGIEITGSHNLVEHNVLSGNDDDGAVDVYNGTGNTITDNAFTDNANGILLGTDGFVIETDVSRTPGGPNDSEYYPILFSTTSSGGVTTVRGRIPQPGTVTVDLYSQARCPLPDHTPPQGADFLGSERLSSRLGGADFKLSFAPVAPGQDAITATATGSDGSTSQFSPCLKTDSRAAQFTDVGVDYEPGGIPIAPTTSNSPDIARAARHRAQPDGHGVLELLCPPITTRGCTGTVTIRTTSRHPVTIARMHFHMPGGFAFPVRLSLPVTLLAHLRRRHRMAVRVRIVAHDGAKHPHHKTRIFTDHLIYSSAA